MFRHHKGGTVSASCEGFIATARTDVEALDALAAKLRAAQLLGGRVNAGNGATGTGS